MAWPTSKPDSNKFSSDGDSIKDSRPELKTMSDAVNNIVDFVDTTGISNGDVLVYDSTSGTIKPGAGGGGGALGPLTTNLETDGFIIGNLKNDSAQGYYPTAIQFTDANQINLITTTSYFPDSAGDQVFLDAGTVRLSNYVPNRISASTAQPIKEFDYSTILFYSRGSLDSAGVDETSQMGVSYGGTGIFISHGQPKVGDASSGNGSQEINMNDSVGILISNSYGIDSATDPNADRIRLAANGPVEISSKLGLKLETELNTGSVTFKIDRDSTTDWGLKLPEAGGVGFMYMTQDDDSAGSPTGDYQLQFNSNPGLSYNWQQITGATTLTSNNAYFFVNSGYTVNLPAYPASGDMIVMTNANQTITINPNGNNLHGTSGNRTMTSGMTIVYQSATGWMILSAGI
jgi:hypothetical protein